MAAGSNGNLGNPPQILWLSGDDDIYVLGAPHYSPRANGQPADNDKLRFRRHQAAEQLIKSWFRQLRRAAPANRISLWLSAIVSARLTLTGRRASSRSLCTLTASALAAPAVSALRVLTGRMLPTQPGGRPT